MPVEQLTVFDAIRHANHDYLNHLQLIHMRLELGNIDAANQLIEQYKVKVRMFSQLHYLQSPQLQQWLQTCTWRYPAFTLHLTAHVEEVLQQAYEEQIVEYLEKTVLHYSEQATATDELQLTIDVTVTQQTKKLSVCVEGFEQIEPLALHNTENIHVDIEEAAKQCILYHLTWQ